MLRKKSVFNLTKQCIESFSKLPAILKNKDYKVVESQDMVLAMISTYDTGLGHALGKENVFKSTFERKINNARRVNFIPAYDFSESGGTYTFRPSEKWIKFLSSPVDFVYETKSRKKIDILDDFAISEQVYEAFYMAEEISRQLDNGKGICTYFFLLAFANLQDSNANRILVKMLSDRHNQHTDLSNYFETSFYYLKYDGSIEREKASEASRFRLSSERLRDPNYSLIGEMTIDLTDEAKSGNLAPVIGRDKEIEQMVIALTRRDKNNVVLLGDGGVGKSAIVDGLAIKIANGEIPALKHMKIHKFNMLDFHSSMGLHYDIGISKLIEEMKRDRDIILFIDEIHMLSRNSYLTNNLKPYMARGDFRLIGATTTSEYEHSIALDKAFDRRFEKLIVEEVDDKAAIEIVSKASILYENFHKVNFSDDIIKLSVILSKRYLQDERIPDSPLTLLDNAASIVRISRRQSIELDDIYLDKLEKLRQKIEEEKEFPFSDERVEELNKEVKKLQEEYSKARNSTIKHEYDLKVTQEDLLKAIEDKTGKIVSKNELDLILHEDEIGNSKLSLVKEEIASRIIGQDHAVEAVVNAVIRAEKGFKYKDKPIGSFLFAGQTGVGKTETAKALAEGLFGSESFLIRLDMSEYQHEHEVAKLIGSPPGYVGYGRGGILTNAVLERKKAVILLDEVEKAHPKIFDTFLQILDDARLTDGMGITVDFSNTILIFTSNLGSSKLKNKKLAIGFNSKPDDNLEFSDIERITKEAIEGYFRPEFINRLDSVITFKPFGKKEILSITKLLLEKEVELIKEIGFKISFTDEAIQYIADRSYDPQNGARPIKRFIKKYLQNLIAGKMVKEEIVKGQNLLIEIEEDQIALKVA